jgi:hypothetical protein
MESVISKRCSDDSVLSPEQTTGPHTSDTVPTPSLLHWSLTKSVSHTSPYIPYLSSAPNSRTRTSAFNIFPTSLPLRLPLPIQGTGTRAFPSCSTTSPTLLSSIGWENGTNATRSPLSPTAPNVPFSSASWRHNSIQVTWQVMVLLFLMHYSRLV